MGLSGEAAPAGGLNIPAMGKGVAITVALAVLASLLAGAVFYFTGVSEVFLSWTAGGILLLSVLAGSIMAVKTAGHKGLVHGVGVGLVSFFLLWIIALIILPGSPAFPGLLQKLLILVGGGAVGGMLGVAV